MRTALIYTVAACVPLAACSTTASLTADRSFVATQATFLSLQQVALAGIKSGTISGATKNRIIDLLVEGQRYENLAYTTRSTASIASLAGIIAQLNLAGVR